jgi:hypothetical protein
LSEIDFSLHPQNKTKKIKKIKKSQNNRKKKKNRQNDIIPFNPTTPSASFFVCSLVIIEIDNACYN